MKILYILQREYSTRIRKSSFWIISFVVPLLVAGLYALPLIVQRHADERTQILIVDPLDLTAAQFHSTPSRAYRAMPSLTAARRVLDTATIPTAILYLPARESALPTDAFLLYRSEVPSAAVQNDIHHQLHAILRNHILSDINAITPDDYYSITHTTIRIHPQDVEHGRDSYVTLRSAIAVLLALLVIIAIGAFGSQVMRSITEEKNNRIAEFLLGTVRPSQLLAGKVMGVGLLGLTQFVVWLVIAVPAIVVIQGAFSDLLDQARQLQTLTLASKGDELHDQMQALAAIPQLSDIVQGLPSVDIPFLATFFLAYFLLGFFLYASLFAGAGALARPDTDTQQFTLPLTLPLLATLVTLPFLLAHPSGPLAIVLSLIPLTSPVAMLVRLPFGVPLWHVVVSLGLLVVTIPLFLLLAARLYRRHILPTSNE